MSALASLGSFSNSRLRSQVNFPTADHPEERISINNETFPILPHLGIIIHSTVMKMLKVGNQHSLE